MTNLAIAALAVSVPWITFVVQVAVIPYWEKSASLYKEYVQSGALAMARSSIESREIIPCLAGMYQRALEGQDDKRRRADMAALLQRVDFIDQLKLLEAAMNKLANADSCVAELKQVARRIGGYGLANAVLSLLVPGCAIFDSTRFYWIASSAVGVSWLWTIVAVGRGIVVYRREIESLVEHLTLHAQAENDD